MHRVPSVPINLTLTWIFSLETPLGHWISFPWGTSILAVLRKPHTPHGLQRLAVESRNLSPPLLIPLSVIQGDH